MPEVTVATLNLFNRQARWPLRAPLIVEQALEHEPDVLAFQEVHHTIDQANWLAWWINAQLGREEFIAYHVFNPRGVWGSESLAIVSRLPAVEHDCLDYLSYDDIAHRMRFQVDGGAFDFYNTHLYYVPSSEGGEIRRREAQRLLEWVDLHGEEVPRVIVGDFNAMPGGKTIGLIKERFRSAHEVVHGDEPDRTWPSPLTKTLNAMTTWGFPTPEIPEGFFSTVDYVFVDEKVDVLGAEVTFNRPDPKDEYLYPSDHFGIVARLRFTFP